MQARLVRDSIGAHRGSFCFCLASLWPARRHADVLIAFISKTWLTSTLAQWHGLEKITSAAVSFLKAAPLTFCRLAAAVRQLGDKMPSSRNTSPLCRKPHGLLTSVKTRLYRHVESRYYSKELANQLPLQLMSVGCPYRSSLHLTHWSLCSSYLHIHIQGYVMSFNLKAFLWLYRNIYYLIVTRALWEELSLLYKGASRDKEKLSGLIVSLCQIQEEHREIMTLRPVLSALETAGCKGNGLSLFLESVIFKAVIWSVLARSKCK